MNKLLMKYIIFFGTLGQLFVAFGMQQTITKTGQKFSMAKYAQELQLWSKTQLIATIPANLAEVISPVFKTQLAWDRAHKKRSRLHHEQFQPGTIELFAKMANLFTVQDNGVVITPKNEIILHELLKSYSDYLLDFYYFLQAYDIATMMPYVCPHLLSAIAKDHDLINQQEGILLKGAALRFANSICSLRPILIQEPTVIGHDSEVLTAQISVDSKYVVTGSWDGTVKIYDVMKGEVVATITHDKLVSSVAISADSKYVVTGSWDGTVKIYDVMKGEVVATITHDKSVSSVAISADNKYVVTGSWDGTAKIYDVVKSEIIAAITHGSIVHSVAMSADSKYVVTGSWNGTAKTYDVKNGKFVATITHGSSVLSVAISSDNKYVVTGSSDKTVKTYDLVKGEVVATINHDDSVSSVAISADSKYVVTGSWDATVKIYFVMKGEVLATITHDKSVSSVAISADNKYVVTSSFDNTCRITPISLCDMKPHHAIAAAVLVEMEVNPECLNQNALDTELLFPAMHQVLPLATQHSCIKKAVNLEKTGWLYQDFMSIPETLRNRLYQQYPGIKTRIDNAQ